MTITDDLARLLNLLVKEGGSDLHLATNEPPRMRKFGALRPIPDLPPLENSALEQMLGSVLSEHQQSAFARDLGLDFSFGVEGVARFRANFFHRAEGKGAVFRVIPFEIKSFEALGLPPTVEKLCAKPRGLVLVTGPTGSGKSTTLAAMIDKINRTQNDHILTLEDPIEFQHSSQMSLVNQREIGRDTPSFASALREALREDPDVILIGEMRDRETIELALRTAETGHLTFGTLHTNSAPSSINRLIDVFPSDQQNQIRSQLSIVLEGVLSQQLVPRRSGEGRAMALEIMTATDGVRNLIRDSKIEQLYSCMQTGYEQFGMQTMEMSLAYLVKSGAIEEQTALGKTGRPDTLRDLIHEGGGPLAKSARAGEKQPPLGRNLAHSGNGQNRGLIQ